MNSHLPPPGKGIIDSASVEENPTNTTPIRIQTTIHTAGSPIHYQPTRSFTRTTNISSKKQAFVQMHSNHFHLHNNSLSKQDDDSIEEEGEHLQGGYGLKGPLATKKVLYSYQ